MRTVQNFMASSFAFFSLSDYIFLNVFLWIRTKIIPEGKYPLIQPNSLRVVYFYSPKAQNPIEQKAISHSLCQHWKRISPGNKSVASTIHQRNCCFSGCGRSTIHFFCDGGNNNCWIYANSNKHDARQTLFFAIQALWGSCPWRRNRFADEPIFIYQKQTRAWISPSSWCKLSARLIDCVDSDWREKCCGLAKCINVTLFLFYLCSEESDTIPDTSKAIRRRARESGISSGRDVFYRYREIERVSEIQQWGYWLFSRREFFFERRWDQSVYTE